MKTITKNLTVLLLAGITLMSFTFYAASGIKGTVTPAENCNAVWAISGTDSLRVALNEGSFVFENAAPGVYKIVVEAKEPYKNFVKEDVEVKDGEVIDLGNITLGQ